jgi:hypothetical protein
MALDLASDRERMVDRQMRAEASSTDMFSTPCGVSHASASWPKGSRSSPMRTRRCRPTRERRSRSPSRHDRSRRGQAGRSCSGDRNRVGLAAAVLGEIAALLSEENR